MATRKPKEEMEPKDVTVDETPMMEELPRDPWLEMREITLPRPVKGEDTHILVGINSRYLRVKKGQKVSVPLPVYERLQLYLDAEEAEDRYQRAVDGKNFDIGNEGAAPSAL